MQDNTIINAVMRLERIGEESSKTVRKLKDAVIEVADFVTGLEYIQQAVRDKSASCGPAVILPRGYWVGWPGCDRRADVYLYYMSANGVPVTLNSLEDDYDTLGLTRAVALRFAKDIAEGWLDELAAWIDERSSKELAAADVLDKAAEERQ